MRKDMKDVIINTIRVGRRYDNLTKTKVHSKTIDELENLPEREGMKRRWNGWGLSPGDRINPLRGWLKRHVGRPWDDVYSELCAETDDRNIRGWHLREHLWMEVDTWQERQCALSRRWGGASEFYIDKKGVLCREERKRYRYESPKDPDVCYMGDRRFERVNNCWFEVWYEKEEKSRKVWSWAQNRKVVEYYSIEVKARQRQLSKRDLRDLDLSNDPDFKWWET